LYNEFEKKTARFVHTDQVYRANCVGAFRWYLDKFFTSDDLEF